MVVKIFVLLYCLVANYDSILAEPDLDWWQTSVFYQIYPRSFKDSNGDGVGDLKGIEQQAFYFKESGIDVVWLSPIYKSPMLDAGYDISNFTEVDPIFGTMEDFDSLLATLKSMGIKVILDFVPNHSSDQCEWFKKSVQKIDPYTDYYVWEDPKGWTNSTTRSDPVPPNNWISAFQGSAWQYDDQRKQFYLHEFLIQQPDLNYRNPAVVEKMKNVMRFWLDKGIDGFRVDAVMYLFEDSKLRDEPVISNETIDGYPAYKALNHVYTTDQPETYDMLAQFRELLDSYKQKDGHTRILMTEAYTSLEKTVRYYGNTTEPMAQIPFNFQLLTNLKFSSNANIFKSIIDSWMKAMPAGQWANWVLGNHDNRRITSRFDPELADGINMLLLLMPGTGIIYNGDELGMLDTKVRWDQTNDESAKKLGEALFDTVSRDPERTPFQWNSSAQAGFSNTTSTTWLPVNPNYYYLNYENQKVIDRSHWNVFRNLTRLRKTNTFQYGGFSTHSFTDWVFGFERNTTDELYIILINLNNEEEYVNLQSQLKNLNASSMSVALASVNSEYNIGDELTTGQAMEGNKSSDNSKSGRIGFSMRPNSALVLQVSLKSPESQGQGSGAYSVLCSSSTAVISVTMLALYLLNFFQVISY